MRFQLRIIAVTLVILITTLALNSVLSLASFEKLYLSSLVSTIELSGKNLKRKIEQALRLGKPFENFTGLDILLAELLRDDSEIASVGVTNAQGKFLYHTRQEMIGQEIPLPDVAVDRQNPTRSQLVNQEYITSIALFDRSDELIGFVRLSFPRAVITRQLQLMATENARILWIVVLAASLGLIIGMTSWITRPLRNQLLCAIRRLRAAEAAQAEDILPDNLGDAVGSPGDFLPQPFEAGSVAGTGVQQAKVAEVKQARNELRQLEAILDTAVGHGCAILTQYQTLRRHEADAAVACHSLENLIMTMQELVSHPQEALSDEGQLRLEQLFQEYQHLISQFRQALQNPEETPG